MIYGLERERLAWEQVIPRLNKLHKELTDFVTFLRNTSRDVYTTELQARGVHLNNIKNGFSSFSTSNGTWFNSSYSDYESPLSGAITSLTSIISTMQSALTNNYWDTELDNLVYMVVSQAHRSNLATTIEGHLQS